MKFQCFVEVCAVLHFCFPSQRFFLFEGGNSKKDRRERKRQRRTTTQCHVQYSKRIHRKPTSETEENVNLQQRNIAAFYQELNYRFATVLLQLVPMPAHSRLRIKICFFFTSHSGVKTDRRLPTSSDFRLRGSSGRPNGVLCVSLSLLWRTPPPLSMDSSPPKAIVGLKPKKS